jgi:superfamily I DNA/RNA helicase
LQFNIESHKLSLNSVEDFAYTYERVKQERGKKDFADMIEMVIDGDFEVPFKVLFIDEAQDFSRMQWEYVAKIMPHLDSLYIAGDDDQSIFPFTGADQFGFLDFQADTTEVLEQSYRVPVAIGHCADRVIERVQRRKEKVVKWTDEQGMVTYPAITRFELPLIRWANGDKDVMILCRHRRMVKYVRAQLEELGLPSRLDGKSSESKVTEIAIIYHDLKSGREVQQNEAARLLHWKGHRKASDAMRKKSPRLMCSYDVAENINFEANWITYLSKGVSQERELIILRNQLRKNGIEVIRQAAKIDVSTYHSAKGREADIVVCLTDCSGAVVKSQNRDPDTEIRLAYVGLTRAKEAVMVLPPAKPNMQMTGLKI